MNVAATPGLGSWMGRRRKAGAAQMTLALTGFFLVAGWMFAKTLGGLKEAGVPIVFPQFILDHQAAVGLAGVVIFGLAWVWSVVTSISIYLSVGAERNAAPEAPPPLPPPV